MCKRQRTSDEGQTSDNSELFSPPAKRVVTVLDEPLHQTSTVTDDTCSNLANSPPTEPIASTQVINSENVPNISQTGTKGNKKKRSKCRNKAKFLNSPPWFLDPTQACFKCERFMGVHTFVHMAHKPRNPIFDSTIFLDDDAANKWCDLFHCLVELVRNYFKASSNAKLIDILNEKLPQHERPLAWSTPAKHVLNLYHEKYYDAIHVNQVSLSPINSIKVLADGLFFRSLMDIAGVDFKNAVNKITLH